MSSEWGPLAALAGEWEGEGGLDTAFSHARGAVWQTPYRERVAMKPFGPVLNGDQALYGLDYRTSMWRLDEDDSFHTEVGYWLWDAATGEVLRGFVVPRGITVLAGGTAARDARSFSMRASLGDPQYSISENVYLSKRASSTSYEVAITLNADETWSYAETTMLQMAEMPEPFAHTDGNTLRRVGRGGRRAGRPRTIRSCARHVRLEPSSRRHEVRPSAVCWAMTTCACCSSASTPVSGRLR
jgi:hypothetical protein